MTKKKTPESEPEIKPEITIEDKLYIKLQRAFLNKYKVITIKSNDNAKLSSGRTMFYYDEDNGIYKQGVDDLLNQFAHDQLGIYHNVGTFNSAMHLIMASNYVDSKLLNSKPYLIALNNGVLNLITKELTPHSPDNYLTCKLPITYDKDATCPNIVKFLTEVLGEPFTDEKGIYRNPVNTFFQMLGSCLWQSYLQASIFLFQGKAGNGKSQVLKLVFNFLGGSDNVSNVSIQRLAGNTFSAARLFGKLANIQADISDKIIDDMGLIKALTGGDPIDAEYKFQNGFTFINHAKLIFSCNHTPATHNQDANESFWRRLILFICKNDFDESPNKKLEIGDALCQDDAEMSGLLNMALFGLDDFREKHNFDRIYDKQDTEKMYQDLSVSVQTFVDRNIAFDYISFESSKDLYNCYVKHIEAIGSVSPLTQLKFTRQFRQECKPQAKYTTKWIDGKAVKGFEGIKIVGD